MARTVKVGLAVDEAPFVRGMKRAEAAAEGLDDALGDVKGSARDTAAAAGKATESFDDLGDSATDTGRGLDRLRADAARLDRQIDDTARTIRDLAREIAATSDAAERADLNKKLNVERRALRTQTSLRKLIDVDSASDMGAELAGRVSVSFSQRLGPLLARAPMAGMNPAALAIGAPLVAGVATLLGTAAAGAIVGGVGIGGVIGGLKLAAKDPAVQAAGAELGEDLSAMLGRASSSFVPVTLGAIDTIRGRTLGMEDDFERLFTSASRYVDPLVDGLFDAADNAMPGLIAAMDAAGPVVEVVADGIRDLGSAVGEGLSDLAPYADEGARALQVLFTVMNGGVGIVFDTLENMARLYQASEIVGAVLTGDLPRAIALTTMAQDTASGSSTDLSDAIGGVGGAAATAAGKALELVDVLQILNGIQLNANEAEREFQAAIDEARDTFDKKVKSINLGTERGREYSAALDKIASTAKTSAQAIYDQTGSVDKANAKIDEGRNALYKQARQYGLSEGAAWAYVDSVLSIPKNWNTDIKATDKATPTINAINARIAAIKSKRVVITVVNNEITTRSEGRNVGIGDGIGGRRWGGIVEHAQWGRLREAHVASPVAPARYAYAEPATGGEAFIPRYGNRERSLGILEHAARWYGQQVVPAGGGAGGGPVTYDNRITVQPLQANFTVHELEGLQRRQDALARVGRPR
ncbi:hypothetical protein O7600_20135 [Micromonospora sp. WMMA1998]|uniref:hypothetical protein n=1 Tax=Micromonospora sp. WMMA1998 TaxID=3015167 RepID=UPI00248C154D|nr:hypothetical protein [Micromonospora sp. WMMA1998]WBC13441.1 hypothetical protein O7600_20135 [Micromonospora sp. WMMA1998]